jgi:hypothetical protein
MVVFLAVVATAGCLPTANPLVTEKDAVFDPAFLGVWVQPGTSNTWTVTHRGDRTFRIVYTDDASRPGQFVGKLGRINDILFLDLVADPSVRKEPMIEQIHSLPIHTLYRVEFSGDRLTLYSIDFEKLKSFVARDPEELPSETWGDRLTITASTEQLRDFVVEHSDMFAHAVQLTREF